MGKPDPSAGQMKGLELMEHPEGDFLPARCSVLGCQGWKGLRAWGAGWTWSSFRARVSEDQWVWLWQSKNLPPPLVGGTSNVPTAGSLSWGWHWHWGLAAGEPGNAPCPPGFGRGTQVFITIPRDMFSFRAGQGWADPFFLFLVFFLRALEDNARLQSWVEVPG